MLPWTRTTLELLVCLLLSPLSADTQVPLPSGTDPVEVPVSFGPPTRWAGAFSTIEPKVQAPSPAPARARFPEGPTSPGRSERSYFVYGLEFKNVAARKHFEASNWPRISAFDRFLEVFVESSDRKRFRTETEADPDLLWLDELWQSLTEPPPVDPPRATRGLPQPPEAIVRGGFKGLTGKGVILAIVDTGVDFRNPDFIKLDAKGQPVSRLLYLWDTRSRAFDEGKGGSRPPLAYPNGASFGTLYTRAQLTAELRATSVGIPTTDENGHGTACAGVAAGNGRNGPGRPEVVGVAPEADIVAVRVGGDVEFLLNSIVDWLDKVRGRQPLVVSLSMGGQMGGHDGMRVTERSLSARFSLETRGRAILIAAGNEARENLHASLELIDATTRKELAWKVPGYTHLQIYADVPDPDLMRISTTRGNPVRSMDLVWSPYRDPGHILIDLAVAEAGSWFFSSPTGRPIRVDAYLPEGEKHLDRAFTRGVVHEAMVATPGTTERAITVGAYIWNEQFDFEGKTTTLKDGCDATPMWIGALACYSNPGFSRSGSVKPEITAPSDVFSASRARSVEGKDLTHKWIVDSSGNYVVFRGTSAATPYAAGVVALIFQKHPLLSLGTLRELLAKHATRNGYTQATPNRYWGYGKLDLVAIEQLLAHAK